MSVRRKVFITIGATGLALTSVVYGIARFVTSQRLSLLSILVAGIVLCLFVQFMLEKVVISPLSRLNRDVSLIAAGNGVPARLRCRSQDEFCTLTSSINRMLDALELTVDQK